jgi:tetratricopeptide (TPR) repeat protein
MGPAGQPGTSVDRGDAVIELLLQAERSLSIGMLDQAEALYRRATEQDPRNAIAVVGLARVALERGDERGAYETAVQALTIDPENAAAVRLETRLAEVFATRGQPIERSPAALAAARTVESRVAETVADHARLAPPPAPGRPDYAPLPGSRFDHALSGTADAEAPQPVRRRGLLDRILGR